MIPSFDGNGLLPPGIHPATWAEVIVRYQVNAHRAKLLGGLKRGCAALHAAGCTRLFLDGSFVTLKDYPSDFDACWDITGVVGANLDPVLIDFSNERAAQKAKYFGEFFPAQAFAESKAPFRRFLDFFQTDKDTGTAKGIIALDLTKLP